MTKQQKIVTWIAALWLILMMVLACIGCAHKYASDVPDSTPAVGSAIDKSKSHVESADALVQKAKPESNTTGKALLDVATDEHGKAIGELDKANVELTSVKKERGQLVEINGKLEDENALVKGGWGYRLQRFISWCWFWIKVYIAAYFLINLAAPFIPGMWGGVLAKIGSWINPFSIVQEGRRLIWKLWMKPKEETPAPASATATPAPVQTPSTTVVNVQLPLRSQETQPPYPTTSPADIVEEAHRVTVRVPTINTGI